MVNMLLQVCTSLDGITDCLASFTSQVVFSIHCNHRQYYIITCVYVISWLVAITDCLASFTSQVVFAIHCK